MNDYPDFSAVQSTTASAGTAPLKALVLDDSAIDRRRLERFCREAELHIDLTNTTTISEFASKIDATSFDLFLIDYRLVQGDGLIALEMLRRHPGQRNAASIMIAGEGQIQIAIDAMKSGCSDFLLKDRLGPDTLSRAITNAIEARGRHEDEIPQHLSVDMARFARRSVAEMRSTLSAILRRTRSMRRATGEAAAVPHEDITAIDENCAKLWHHLEEYQGFISQVADPDRGKLH